MSFSSRAAAVLVVAVAVAGCSSGQPDARPSSNAESDAPAGLRPTTVGAPLSSAAVLDHAVKPVLAADDAGGLLLAAEPGTSRNTRSVVAAYRDADGRWERPVVLARDSDLGAPSVAAGGDGRAVVGWTSYAGSGMSESVRIREPDGQWSRRHEVARDSGSTTMTDLDVNGRGDVAVLAAEGESFRVVRHSAGSRWTTTTVPDCTAGTLALDDRGVAHVACVGSADRGAQGRVRLWTQQRTGSLVLERRLGRAVSVALQVDPDGVETVTLGTGADGNAEVVTASSFEVLRQASPGGPLERVWSRSRTTSVLASATGDRLRVAWEEHEVRRPRATLLRVQTVLPLTGPVITVDRQARSAGGGDAFDYDLAAPPTGSAVLLWRRWQDAAHEKVGAIRLIPLLGTGGGRTTVLPGGARDVVDQFLTDREQLAVSSAGRVELAWLRRAGTRPGSAGDDRVTSDGTVQVARLRPRP